MNLPVRRTSSPSHGTTDFQSVAWCYSTDWKSVVQIADGKFYPAARLKGLSIAGATPCSGVWHTGQVIQCGLIDSAHPVQYTSKTDFIAAPCLPAALVQICGRRFCVPAGQTAQPAVRPQPAQSQRQSGSSAGREAHSAHDNRRTLPALPAESD